MLVLDPRARAELGPEAGRLAGGFVDRATAMFGSPGRARLAIALIDGLLLDELTRGPGSAGQRRAAPGSAGQRRAAPGQARRGPRNCHTRPVTSVHWTRYAT